MTKETSVGAFDSRLERGTETPLDSTEQRRERRLKKLFWVAAIALSLLFAWADRHGMRNDGISYLDMGDAYLRGDWEMAINGYWSPLYPILLGLAMRALRPSPYWEFAVAHLVNLFVYLWALSSFSFFLGELIRYHRHRERLAGDGWMSLPGWAWLVLGYTLFIWTSQMFITVYHVSPDLCMAACVFLASGITLRIRRGETSWRVFILLGTVLGLGYLAKAPMFPLSFVFLLVSLLAVDNLRRAVPRVGVALLVFFLIAGPYVVALSRSKGRLTFGDSGKINYAVLVGRLPRRHWQGAPEGSGTPRHPTRQLSTDPPMYEFGSPIGGTYPNWYDPSYWFDGVRIRFQLGRHLRNMLSTSRLFVDLLFALHSSLVISLAVLVYTSGRGLRAVRDAAAGWLLLVPALAALLMYMQVYVEPRYVGVFVVLLFTGLFSSVRLRGRREDNRLVGCLMVIIATMLTLSLSRPVARAAAALVRNPKAGWETVGGKAWRVADGLKRMGVLPGQKAASLTYSNLGHTQWARLARVQIIAEIFSEAPEDDEKAFWASGKETRKRVLDTFSKAGADIVVGSQVPKSAADEGWQRIGDTDYHVYFVRRS